MRVQSCRSAPQWLPSPTQFVGEGLGMGGAGPGTRAVLTHFPHTDITSRTSASSPAAAR